MGRSRSAASPTTRRSPASQARGDRDVFVFRFSPDGRYLATTHIPGYALTVWDIDRRAVARRTTRGPSADRGPVQPGQPADRRVPSGWRRRSSTTWRPGGPPALARAGVGTDLAFRPDGARIAILHDERDSPTCRILEAETGRLVRSIPLPPTGDGSPGAPTARRWRRRVEDRKIYLWDAATGSRKAILEGSYQRRPGRGLPPRRHAAGQQRLGEPARLWDPVLGRPLLSMTAERLSRRNSARTDGSSSPSRTS